MKRIIGEWVWRVVMVCALGWIALELHGLREELSQPPDDGSAVTADTEGEDSQGCVDAVQQRVRGADRAARAQLASIASR